MIFLPTVGNLQYSAGLFMRLLMGVPIREWDFARMGVQIDNEGARQRFEHVSWCAVQAYNHALGEPDPTRLAFHLDNIVPELRGFAYEGAGMGLMTLDMLLPWRRGRLHRFLEARGGRPDLPYIGAGNALASLFRPLQPTLDRSDPIRRWLVADGYGFFNGFFRRSWVIDQHWIPATVSPLARRDFDAGVGRSVWFTSGADPVRAAATIASLPEERRPDIWQGVGYAVAYAGGVEREVLRQLVEQADGHRIDLQRGVSVAAHTRGQAGNIAEQVERATEEICGLSAQRVFELGERAEVVLQGEPMIDGEPALWLWRRELAAAVQEAARR